MSLKTRYKSIFIMGLFLAMESMGRSAFIVPETKGDVRSDLFFEYKIAELDKQSPIALEYNQAVKEYIDLFTGPRKKQFSKIIGLSKLYFPIFEEYLTKYDLPIELKYLSIVESALDPMAKSVSGAVGLWQFKINTGKMFDLKVDSYLDERRDPFKSTVAACQYLSYLYKKFNDWHLAMAAYNGGPGEVHRALKKAGKGKSYWEIISYLPEQTQKYIPAFIAANYVLNHYKEHGIEAKEPEYTYYETDTVHISKPLTFYDLQKVMDISIAKLRLLNPAYKRNYIPEYGEGYILVLPKGFKKVFYDKKDFIYSGRDEKQTEINYMVYHGEKDKKRPMSPISNRRNKEGLPCKRTKNWPVTLTGPTKEDTIDMFLK